MDAQRWCSQVLLEVANVIEEDHGDGMARFDTGAIHYSFMKSDETITAEEHCKELHEMRWKIQLLCPALVNRKGSILLHDNAQPRILEVALVKLNELGNETLPHPTYSLRPADFF